VTAFAAFFDRLIDYAGLFPPARLPLDQAVRDYARHRLAPDSWMLGRFILPTTRLDELAGHREQLAAKSPVGLSVLGRGGVSAIDFLGNLELDLRDVTRFRKTNDAWSAAQVLETKSPIDALVNHDSLANVTRLGGGAGLALFHEVGLAGDWRSAVTALAGIDGQGLKLRCGGLDATAFPTAEQVAAVIVACRDADVPLKCTAGLHHPVRRYEASVKTKMHGFLNVFGAGILARVHALSATRVQEIIEDENAASFAFEGDTFCWRDLKVASPAIRDARQRGMVSFGSCSFDEPRDDLRALGYGGSLAGASD
jgi:hypothetical protein